jgi:hypothetical protein
VKDALERKLHKLVCAGQLDLKTAQSQIASNWIEAYQKYVAKSPPAPRVRETKPAPATSTASEVWVNTRSGKYWKSGPGITVKLKRANSCRSWMRLIVDIPQQVERANRLRQVTKAYEGYRWPNNQGCDDRTRKCFGSVRRSIEHDDQDSCCCGCITGEQSEIRSSAFGA